ncbi:MAG: NADH:flavin oxidoreductase/NADH oxidase, partial [Brevibacterium aurantiacum]
MTHLFSPMTMRGTEIANRIWLAPMCQYSCESEDGVPGTWHLVHLGARAQGGFGLILTEASAVLPEGRISPQDAGIWNDDQADAWSSITEFVHSQGSRIGVQLAHAGRKASTYRPFEGNPRGSVPESEGGWPTLGASAIAYPGYDAPQEMTKDDIAEVVEAFAAAA